MKKLHLLLILACVFLIGIGVSLIVYSSYYLLDYEEIRLSVRIEESGAVAFNNSNESLNFGRNFAGGESTKYITLVSKSNARVLMTSEGNISEFISFDKNNFMITKDEPEQIQVFLKVPENAPLGSYSGTLKIYFFRK